MQQALSSPDAHFSLSSSTRKSHKLTFLISASSVCKMLAKITYQTVRCQVGEKRGGDPRIGTGLNPGLKRRAASFCGEKKIEPSLAFSQLFEPLPAASQLLISAPGLCALASRQRGNQEQSRHLDVCVPDRLNRDLNPQNTRQRQKHSVFFFLFFSF